MKEEKGNSEKVDKDTNIITGIINAQSNNISVKEKPKGITIYSAADIQKMSLPEINWIIPDFLAEGFFLLAGRPKCGKSWMALNIALAVAQGGKAMSFFQCTKYDVLYIAYEDNLRRIQDRLRKILEHNNQDAWPTNLFFAGLDDFPKINNGGLDKLQHMVNENPDLKVIIVDTFGRGYEQKRSKNGNHFQDDYDYGAVLQNFALGNGVCLLVIHHTRKGNSEDPFEDIAGTNGLQASTDGLMILKDNQAKATLNITGKDIPAKCYEVELDDCVWRILGTTQEDNLSPEKQAIVNVLRANPDIEMTPTLIAEKLNKEPSNISHQLTSLHKDGKISRPKYGKYRALNYDT